MENNRPYVDVYNNDRGIEHRLDIIVTTRMFTDRASMIACVNVPNNDSHSYRVTLFEPRNKSSKTFMRKTVKGAQAVLDRHMEMFGIGKVSIEEMSS